MEIVPVENDTNRGLICWPDLIRVAGLVTFVGIPDAT